MAGCIRFVVDDDWFVVVNNRVWKVEESVKIPVTFFQSIAHLWAVLFFEIQ